MADLPQITAIVCTYQRPEMLKRCLTSILHQTYQNFQICIYDNASGDETGDIAADFARQDTRIKYHCRPENIGLLANYSRAMQAVQTPFFSFIADDDVMLPDFYLQAIAAMNQYPEAMLFAGSYLCLSLAGKKMGGASFNSEQLLAPAGAFQFIESNTYPNLHGTLLRREVIDSFSEFKYLWSDRELLCRIAAVSPVLTSDVESLLFTMHNLDKGQSRDITIEYAWQVHETISTSLQQVLDQKSNQRLQEIFRSQIRDSIYLIGIELLYAGDLAGARVGAKRIRQDYGTFWPPFILNLLATLFEKLPFIRRFLVAVRYLNFSPQQISEKSAILSYEALMEIYRQRQY